MKDFPCAVSASELAHDRKQAEAATVYEIYKEEALSSVVEDVMDGKKVEGLTLQDYLECMVFITLPEIVSAAIISGGFGSLKDAIERRLRQSLEDSDAVSDRCWELDEAARERMKERD